MQSAKLSATKSKKQKVSLITLGCSKNLVDSELMLGSLAKEGFEFSQDPSKSDVIVINTCGFIDKSKEESVNKILEMAELKKLGNKVLVATGCLTQRYLKELEVELPEVDMFLGLGEFDQIGSLLKRRMVNHEILARSINSDKQILPDPDLPRILSTPKHYTYIKVSEGCNHRCSFCVIPHIRGDLKSRSPESITQGIRNQLAMGVKEFNFIAQDLNEYGFDLKDKSNLTSLIESVDKIKGDFWVRLHYMYPLEFTQNLIDTIAKSEHVAKYIDMPLQHVNDRILLSMRRGSGSRYIRQLLSKLYQAMPDLTLRSTFIVGYPGETEAEFAELESFVKEGHFSHVGVFKYSVEESTAAAKLPGRLPEEILEERYGRLMKAQQEVSYQRNREKIGKTFTAICEGISDEHEWVLQARLSSQAPEVDGVTYLSDCDPAKIKIGDFMQVKIVDAADYDLIATPV